MKNLSIPGINCKLWTIENLFNTYPIEYAAPIFDGFIYCAIFDGILEKYNIFEIDCGNGYFEYVGFEFSDGIVDIHFAQFFYYRKSKHQFLNYEKYLDLKPKYFEFNLWNEIGRICDAVLAYQKNEIKFLILHTLLFDIEILQNDNQLINISNDEIIPLKKTFQIPSGDADLMVIKKYLNTSMKKSISLPNNLDFPLETNIYFNAGFSSYITIGQDDRIFL